MTIWDDRILEYLLSKDGKSASVGELGDSSVVHVSGAHVSRRCRKLADNGLLLPIGNGVYQITDEGEAYLDGEYNAEEGAYVNAGTDEGPTASGTETGEL